MPSRTHLKIDPTLCGEITDLRTGAATVRLRTTPAMAADERGLVHGGFVFGAADYAAMLAVNDPNVVLGSAEVKFTAPVTVGQTVVITAVRFEQKGRKHMVQVEARVAETVVLNGTMTTFVLDEHVLG